MTYPTLRQLPKSVTAYSDGRLPSPTEDVIDDVLYELPKPLTCSWPRCNDKAKAVYARATKNSRPWRVLCPEHVQHFKP
jgi:hypothetical protein